MRRKRSEVVTWGPDTKGAVLSAVVPAAIAVGASADRAMELGKEAKRRWAGEPPTEETIREVAEWLAAEVRNIRDLA